MYDGRVILTDAHEDIVGSGMPLDEGHSPLVVFQRDDGLCHVDEEPSIGHLPYLDGTVVRGTGDDVVVEGTPLNICDGLLVTSDNWCILVLSSILQIEKNV